jgi:glyoxylase-like metal-dependent hydrolase (beta-lactamase superfamily II)
MIHEILPVGPLQCNCSIIGDETTREAMVIDPGDEIESILALVRKHNLQVKQIVVTHAHIDHVGGAMKLRAANSAQSERLRSAQDARYPGLMDWRAISGQSGD